MNPVPVPPTRWFSLRRRLLALLLGGMTLGWVITLALSYRDAHHEIDEIFDANLIQVTQLLLALASEYDDDDDVAHLAGDFHQYQKKIVFQLWDAEGNLLLRSRHAPRTPLTLATGFSEGIAGDRATWRYFSQWDEEGDLRAVAGENHDVRQELAGHIASRLLVPAAFGLPLLAAWIWFATRRALAPLDAIASQVEQREPEHLTPLIPRVAPLELRTLLTALNGLLGRVGQALHNERRFTADAAHELRTPLAALRVQATVASQARDQAERDHALGQLTAGARRASHLLDQLLTLARLDPNQGLERKPIPLADLAAALCADLAGPALDKDIHLELNTKPDIRIPGNPALVSVLVRNLVDNAIRYTPVGGRVQVALAAEGDRVALTVSDDGPGIPPDQREQVLQRFHRLAGQDIQGSGLGLSIVARIAELHGARLSLGDGLPNPQGSQGLCVRVDFPLSRHADET